MKGKPFGDCYWVEPSRLLAGQYPGAPDKEPARARLQGLLRAGIETFVNLTEAGEHQLKPYDMLLQKEAAKLGRSVRHIRMPIPDGSAGSAADIVRVLELIEESLAAERPVYLHCFGGHGRTGMTVGCFLVQNGLGGREALERVDALHSTTSKSWYPSPETEEQIRMVLNWEPRPTRLDRIAGCMLGGAAGDALGYPIEFLKLPAIRERFGVEGIRDFSGLDAGIISDDTQMLLFTAEGLIRAAKRGWPTTNSDIADAVHQAYLRWLSTQESRPAPPAGPGVGSSDGWLVTIKGLHKRRAPGLTCLGALKSGKMGTIEFPLNDSKGCGGIMRVAPAGLAGCPDPFDAGCRLAAITHGHPSGYLSSGFLAQLIHRLANGISLTEAIADATLRLKSQKHHEECLSAVEMALKSAARGAPSAERVESLGAGWVGEEALAISLYCSIVAGDFGEGVRLAVNHGGDSDSTGAITGNILGTIHGRRSIPADWLAKLELREVIEQVGKDVYLCFFGVDPLVRDAARARYSDPDCL